MHVFIDDSGDATVPGINPYFALSAVAFDTEEHQQGMESAILQLRQEWGKTLREHEFKFARLGDADRRRFFAHVANLPFKHSSCVLYKGRRMAGQWKDRCYVYERVIRGVVDGLTPYFREVDAVSDGPLKVRVVFDQCDDLDYRKLLKVAFFKLRSKDGSGMVKSVKPGKSASSTLIQLADMVCGANRWDADHYRQFLAVQQLGRQLLP